MILTIEDSKCWWEPEGINQADFITWSELLRATKIQVLSERETVALNTRNTQGVCLISLHIYRLSLIFIVLLTIMPPPPLPNK